MTDTRRRDVLRRSLVAAILPLAGLAARRAAAQDDLPRAENGHALDYVQNAENADSPRYQEGQQCSTCVFWRGEDAEWGPCQHPQFRNVLVAANGWCSAFAPR